ncbi:MAG: (4Fe-4S)-binding protein [Candidatus Kapaibacteriota bacterium]|jgi:uncharacterized Fe-S cluster protein YjdI
MEEIKTYSSKDVTVVWRPALCEHSTHCFRSLPEVFNVLVNPWIQPEKAAAERVIDVVRRCPSGALTIQGSTEERTSE